MPVALLISLALIAAAPDQASPLSGLTCAPFTWVKAGSWERAAMTTRVKVNGKTLTFQIDTGADETVLYASAADALRLGAKDKALIQGDVMEVGGAKLVGTSLYVNRDIKGGDGSDGTLGLQSLLGRVTVIDYPGQRLCILDRGKVAGSLWAAPKWTAATLRDGKLFVPLRVGDVTLHDVVFDTGSSLLPLVVDEIPWRALTGKTDPKMASETFTGNAWGKSVSFQGDPAKSQMTLGKVGLATPIVYTKLGSPTDLESWPFHVDGIIGNAPLWDTVVVLDLNTHVRMGVIEPGQVARSAR